MKKVLVIGSGGAGKSTLALRLGEVLRLPVVHLDALHWKPGWTVPDQGEWRERVAGLAGQEEWVMDGNFGNTLDLRIPAADTVVFMDFPALTCVWRVLKRRLQYRDGTRPDMAPGCPERLNWAFLKWVWTFRSERRPRILKAVEEHGRDAVLVVLRGPRQASDFLSELERKSQAPGGAPRKRSGVFDRRPGSE